MKKIIFKTVFFANILWGIIFALNSLDAYPRHDHHYASNPEDDGCDISLETYRTDQWNNHPSLFGSKTLGYYSAFCFFNPGNPCEKGGGVQVVLRFFWFFSWFVPLMAAPNKNWLIIIPTIISILGILFFVQ